MSVVVVTADVDRPGTAGRSAHRSAHRPARLSAYRSGAVAVALLGLLLVSGCEGTADGSVSTAASSPTTTPGAAATATATRGTATTSAPASPPLAPLAGTPDSQTYPFRPTSVVLPSGATAAVDPAGVDSVNALQVPDDLARVGWWTGGALVGEPFGSVVLAGHLDSKAQGIGVMAELLDLAVDDRVVVGDGTRTQAYRVVSVDAVPKARLGPDFEAFRQDVDHRLVLITCGGTFDRVAHSYADNVVVVAVPTT